MKNKMKYPAGAEFAFTILDDTDDTTVENGRPVYDFLTRLGFRTTKTVWAFDTAPENRGPYFAGETLASPEYLEWAHELADNGFEIAFHNATMGSSPREDTIRALDFIHKEFGQQVRLHCNHGQNRENLHWGIERYNSYIIRKILRLYTQLRTYPEFEGNDALSPYYWADVANERLSYIRDFTFRRLNCGNIPPGRPYVDRTRQSKLVFFNTTEASDVLVFNKFVNNTSIDKLHQKNGWAIVSTHLGKGFYRDGRLNPEFKHTMEYLASLPGWFVPASQLLDYISTKSGTKELSTFERSKVEILHIVDRISGRIFDRTLY